MRARLAEMVKQRKHEKMLSEATAYLEALGYTVIPPSPTLPESPYKLWKE